jgi:hypothetical protein
MIFKNRESKCLEEWLEMAAKGIASAGKERITREIEAHYADTVGIKPLGALRSKPERPVRRW